MSDTATRTLDEQRIEFANRRLIATPIAGTIMWALIGVAGATLSPLYASLVLFFCTGTIVYLGMFISRFTGENFLDKSRPKNEFDRLFLMTVLAAALVYAIAIPFFMIDYQSLPLTVGVLTGLMWLPFSWIIQHWVGIFHAVVRTALIVALWYALPEQRFVTIPFVIVAIYLVSIYVLEMRWRRRQRE